MKQSAKIYVAGHRGLVGSAIERTLRLKGFDNIVTRTSSELDLKDQAAVRAFFKMEQPEYVFLAAAKVGGILANSTYPADFIYENIIIETNVIQSAHIYGVKKLLFLGSTCIYPRMAKQPIKEESLLSGPLESTNEWYAIAKIAGIKLCQAFSQQYGCNFVSAMPTNLYGPGDNFDLKTSHVLPALIRKIHGAKVSGAPSVEVWGSGTPRREFLYVDDCANACVHLMGLDKNNDIINIGTGQDLMISELAALIKNIVGFEGDIQYDNTKPDGTPKKVTEVSKLLATGWRPLISLNEGISNTYQWYMENS